MPTIYDAGPHTFTCEQIGTRYLFLLVRTFVDPNDPADLAAVHALQDAIRVEPPARGAFEIPRWDEESLTRIRRALQQLGGISSTTMFGAATEVNPVHHLIGTATGWGGNPAVDARYQSVTPADNGGTTVHRLTVRDVPVDAFWSISVCNRDGFFEPNPQSAYSLNSSTAVPDPSGAYTIQFGGCDWRVANCLPIMPGWNYTVRLYRPRPEVLDGTWTFPTATAAESTNQR